MRMLTTLVTGLYETIPIHRALQARWAPKNPAAADAIRAALVVCADHELNVSAFTARCVASTGSSPYDVVAAALAALKGSKHGGASACVSRLFDDAGAPKRAHRILASRLRNGERVPGFGHPLYPRGDPRGGLLLGLAESSGNRNEWRFIRSMSQAARDLSHDLPNLDFGLVALARAYRFPVNAPILMFALGRTIGWIGHAIEQYAQNELIRPRARYIGPAPPESCQRKRELRSVSPSQSS